MIQELQYHKCIHCNGTGKILVRKKNCGDLPGVTYYGTTTVEKFYFEPCDDCSGSGKIQY